MCAHFYLYSQLLLVNLDKPLTSYSLDELVPPTAKLGMCKSLPASCSAAAAKAAAPLLRPKVSAALGASLLGPPGRPLECEDGEELLRAARPFAERLQLKHVGFVPNARLQRQAGLAVLDVAQRVRAVWAAAKSGRGEGASERSDAPAVEAGGKRGGKKGGKKDGNEGGGDASAAVCDAAAVLGWRAGRFREGSGKVQAGLGWRALLPLPLLVFHGVLTLRRNVDWRENEGLLRSGVAHQPTNSKLHYNLGFVLAKSRVPPEPAGAIRHLREARALEPALTEAACIEADVLRETGRPAEAVSVLRDALAQVGPNAPAHRTHFANIGLGEALFALGRPDEALHSYSPAVVAAPHDLRLALAAVNAAAASGNGAAHRLLLNHVLRIDPTHAEAKAALGALGGGGY